MIWKIASLTAVVMISASVNAESFLQSLPNGSLVCYDSNDNRICEKGESVWRTGHDTEITIDEVAPAKTGSYIVLLESDVSSLDLSGDLDDQEDTSFEEALEFVNSELNGGADISDAMSDGLEMLASDKFENDAQIERRMQLITETGSIRVHFEVAESQIDVVESINTSTELTLPEPPEVKTREIVNNTSQSHECDLNFSEYCPDI